MSTLGDVTITRESTDFGNVNWLVARRGDAVTIWTDITGREFDTDFITAATVALAKAAIRQSCRGSIK